MKGTKRPGLPGSRVMLPSHVSPRDRRSEHTRPRPRVCPGEQGGRWRGPGSAKAAWCVLTKCAFQTLHCGQWGEALVFWGFASFWYVLRTLQCKAGFRVRALLTSTYTLTCTCFLFGRQVSVGPSQMLTT